LLGDKRINTGKYEEESFAVGFLYKNNNKINISLFEKIIMWLKNGISNWGQTYFLLGKALGYLIGSLMTGKIRILSVKSIQFR